MAALPLVLIAAGGALGAVGAIQKGQAEAEAARLNAQTANENAAATIQQGYEEERRQRIMARKQLGDMRANYGASGVSIEGSPLDVLEESAASAEMDALTIRYNADFRGYQYRQQAKNDLLAADNAEKNATWEALGSGVGSFASLVSKAPDKKKTKLTRTG